VSGAERTSLRSSAPAQTISKGAVASIPLAGDVNGDREGTSTLPVAPSPCVHTILGDRLAAQLATTNYFRFPSLGTRQSMPFPPSPSSTALSSPGRLSADANAD
jgi:hypothetical protein